MNVKGQAVDIEHRYLFDLVGRFGRWVTWFLGALAFWALISCRPAELMAIGMEKSVFQTSQVQQ